MAIKAVVFDFGGVLVRTGTPTGRREWEARLHLVHGTLEQVVHGSQVWLEAQAGQITPEAYWQVIAQTLGIQQSDISTLRTDYFRDDQLDSGLIKLIESLKQDGYKVGLLSNDALTLEDKLRDLGIATVFDAIVISAKIGVLKPHAQAYHAIAQALNVRLDNCMFIDDNAANVLGAQQAGMIALQYQVGMDVRAALDEVLKDNLSLL